MKIKIMSCRGPYHVVVGVESVLPCSIAAPLCRNRANVAMPTHTQRVCAAHGARVCGVRCTCVQRMGCGGAAYGFLLFLSRTKVGIDA